MLLEKWEDKMPATQQKVWQAIQSAQNKAAE
jgi:hypothetical protein